MHDFFTLVKHQSGHGFLEALVNINKDHPILKGHFPGRPVVPGVCMMQIVKELLEMQLQKTLQIREAENMKFLSVIDPDQDPEINVAINYSIESEIIPINATMFSGEVVFFKLKAVLQYP